MDVLCRGCRGLRIFLRSHSPLLVAPDQQTTQLIAVTAIFLAFGLAEVLIGKFFATEAGREDNRLDVAVGIMFPLVLGSVIASANALCTWLIPEARGAWAHWPLWAMIATLLVADDLTQYWWHRLSHTSVMWPLHRAHHSAQYMSVRVVYRNNLFYYAMMPGLWFGGALLYLGFGWTFVWYSVVKLLVIIGAPAILRLAVVIPAAVSASGYFQAHLRFCANYGWRGIFNLGEIGDDAAVVDRAARSADRRLALRIGFGSLAIGLVTGIVAALLPI